MVYDRVLGLDVLKSSLVSALYEYGCYDSLLSRP